MSEEQLYSEECFQSLPADEPIFHWSDFDSIENDEFESSDNDEFESNENDEFDYSDIDESYS